MTAVGQWFNRKEYYSSEWGGGGEEYVQSEAVFKWGLLSQRWVQKNNILSALG